jgi:serine protease AprX
MGRVFVRYPQKGMREKLSLAVDSEKGVRVYNARTNTQISILDVTDEGREVLRAEGATVYENIKFDKFPGRHTFGLSNVEELEAIKKFPLEKTLGDIVERISAPKAWERTKGKGVTIAIVDSGITGNRCEFANRSDLDVPSAFQGNHWQDENGHGTMCASIACGSTASSGRYSGVAPEATLLSARTSCETDDIYDIYEQLIIWKNSGKISGPLVINNSYGMKICTEPYEFPQDHPYLDLVKEAVSAGIIVVFAAGNNHREYCGHDANNHSPNTIWAANSADEILCVGAVDWNDSNTNPETPHSNSSRGPGQWSATQSKPDCVAPCYGEVLWRSSYLYLPWWGTSGAAPQVAGLAALALSQAPQLKPDEVGDLIRSSCERLSGHKYCVGQGMINCQSVVAAL